MGRETIQTSEEQIRGEAARMFTLVRDVPFILGTQGNPNSLLSDNKGHCTNKHLYLRPRLQQLGYHIELGIAQFDWRDIQPIPKDITVLLKDPIDTHLFLYATRNDKEMVVDATWDPGMPDGFPVNTWDGDSQTSIGVPVLSVHRISYHVLTARAALGSLVQQILTDQPKPTPFNDAFNAWLGRANL